MGPHRPELSQLSRVSNNWNRGGCLLLKRIYGVHKANLRAGIAVYRTNLEYEHLFRAGPDLRKIKFEGLWGVAVVGIPLINPGVLLLIPVRNNHVCASVRVSCVASLVDVVDPGSAELDSAPPPCQYS